MAVKKCKGTGKAKGFDACGDELPFTERNGIKTYDAVYGLGKKCGCYARWLTTTDLGKQKLKEAVSIGKKKAEKEERLKTRAEKEKLIDYRKKLQSKIQEIARLIDIGLPCLARGFHANQMHGGHVYAKGGNSSMALNLHNIHRQGAQSNHFQNDDGLLREGLHREYGSDYLIFVGELRRTPQIHYSNNEYKSFYKRASEIALTLKRNGNTFNKYERIKMRNKLNIDLGIYAEEFCIFSQ